MLLIKECDVKKKLLKQIYRKRSEIIFYTNNNFFFKY